MARITTKLVKLRRQLATAERREEIQQQELQRRIQQQVLTPYQGRGNLTTYYVNSFKEDGLMIKVEVPTESLTKIFGEAAAGITALGGLVAEPTSGAVADNKGFASHYFRMKFVHYRATPIARLTPWGSRVLQYYEEDGDQAFREFPMGGSMNQIQLAYAAKVAAPAPFTRGIIALVSSTGDTLRSTRITPQP